MNEQVKLLLETAESKVSRFDVIQPIVQKLSTVVPLIPELGEVRIITPKSAGQQAIKQDGRLMAYTAALNFILNQGLTTDALLTASLQGWNRNHGFGLDGALFETAAIKINNHLKRLTLVSKEETFQQFLDEETGELRKGKVFLINPKLDRIIEKRLEKARKKAIKFAPLMEGSLDDLYATGRIKEVKGSSRAHGMHAKRKMEAVQFAVMPSWTKWAKQAMANIEQFVSEDKSVLEIERELQFIAAIEKGIPLNFVLTYDPRGRMYYRGGETSPQAGKFSRGALQLYNAEALTDDGEKSRMIYIGRLLGCKESDEVSEVMALSHIDELENLSPQELIDDHGVAVKDAFELWSVVNTPERAIIRLDGSCNGIQHMAAIVGDLKAAELVNLTGGKLNDLYNAVANELGCSRGQAKAIVMPYSYGASIGSLLNTYNDSVSPEDALDYKQMEQWLRKIDKLVPSIRKFTTAMKTEAQIALKSKDRFRWELPDFTAIQTYEDCNKVWAGQFYIRTSSMETDQRKMEAALPPNFIHSLDAYHMRKVVESCDFDVVTIHDSFGCHANNVAKLRKIIIREFIRMYKEGVHTNALTLAGFDPYFAPKFGVNDMSETESHYMFN